MLSREEVRLLSGLSLGAGASVSPSLSATLRRARVRGSGLEFHEYRHYEPGDDPRSIDWTVEARLRQLVVRVARADGHVALHALVDASASMALGAPDKLACARRIAATLCYVALERRDTAGVATFASDVRTLIRPAGGRGQFHRAVTALAAEQAAGASDIGKALMRYGATVHGPGLAVVISDFLSPDRGITGFEYLLHKGLSPAAVQILAPEETDPSFLDAELIDAEDPGAAALPADQSSITAYRLRLATHLEELRAFCAERGIPLARVSSSDRYEAIVHELERIGLVGGHG